MKTKVVVNPKSASGKTEKEWSKIESYLVGQIGPVHTQFTKGVGDATRVTREALLDGFERIIAVGGDGTINEVVNGFFQGEVVINPEAILSIIMRGTGGDFRKTMGLKKDYQEAIKALKDGTIHPIDIGKLTYIGNDGNETIRYFNNIASFGMGGEVDRRVNASAASKVVGGSGSFLWNTLRTMVLYENKRVRLKVDDHFDEELTVRNIAVANGQFHGGGMWVAPYAKPDDGFFDITIIGDLSRTELLMFTTKFYNGKLYTLSKVKGLRGKLVKAESDEEVLLDVDGEAPGRLPATFELLHHAIKLKY